MEEGSHVYLMAYVINSFPLIKTRKRPNLGQIYYTLKIDFLI